MQNIRILEADLAQPDHQQATLNMVDAYSRDAMGDGKPLAANVRATLIDGLRAHPTTILVILSTLNPQRSTSVLSSALLNPLSIRLCCSAAS